MSCLSVSDLTKRFGANIAVDEISLEIKPHKINLLMGSNGSGKTTLINCISGFFRADSGKVLFCDNDISNKRPDQVFKKGIIRTFQTPRLFENLSVLENLLMAQVNSGEKFRNSLFYKRWQKQELHMTQKAISILESFELKHLMNNSAYDLSGGQIKLLELGKVLMSDCKIVLLDEPIAGINPVLAHKIFKKIVEICKQQKTTLLIIEHRLDIALQYCDFCFVMSNGKVIAKGSPDEVLKNKQVVKSYLGK